MCRRERHWHPEQRSKFPYVMIRGTGVVNKTRDSGKCVREVFDRMYTVGVGYIRQMFHIATSLAGDLYDCRGPRSFCLGAVPHETIQMIAI